MSRLRPGDVVCFDTPYGWVGTVAQYDRELPKGAMIVHPGPFLSSTQAEVDEAVSRNRPPDFTFQVVTKASGEPDRLPYQNDPAHAEWVFVRDIHTPHEPHYPDAVQAYGYKDEGFYAYSEPTLMHRVAETDSPELAKVLVEHDPDGSTLDEVLVERHGRAA